MNSPLVASRSAPNTVAKLLKELGYRLRVNAKKLNRQKDPGRDVQFAYIAAMREDFSCVFLRNLPPILAETCHPFSLKLATP